LRATGNDHLQTTIDGKCRQRGNNSRHTGKANQDTIYRPQNDANENREQKCDKYDTYAANPAQLAEQRTGDKSRQAENSPGAQVDLPGQQHQGFTNGDNGIAGLTRPAPFGISINSPASFYWFVLIVAAFAFLMMAIFVSSAFGSSLKGVRDQPRRMAALGFNPWLIRWITFIYAGFWGGVSGLLFVYYHKYIHPVSLSLANSAEGLLAVIAGGSGTLAGPLVGAAIVMLLKNYVSAYVERWNMLLGFVFVVIVVFMPDGVVPGVKRLWRRYISRA